MMKGFQWCPHCGEPHALWTLSCPSSGKPLVAALGRPTGGLPRDTVIGQKYRLRTWIGEESVSLLYHARHVDFGRRVVVKHVRADAVTPEDCIAEALEMEREARVAAMVDHANVAAVTDFGRLPKHEAFLVRERSSSTTLAAALRVAGALEPEDARDLLAQILSGLDALHGAGIIHRDLGSHTIFMNSRAGCRHLPKIGGLGRCIGPGMPAPKDGSIGAHYASPELIRNDAIDHRSDIFSCGVLLFEMLTGRRPFEASTPGQVRESILNDAPPAVSDLVPRLGPIWSDVLARALHKDPAQRPQTALEMLGWLPAHEPPSTRLRSLPVDADNDRTSHAALPVAAPLAAQANRASGVKGATALTTATRPSAWASAGHAAHAATQQTDEAPVSSAPMSRRGSDGGSKCDPYIGRQVAGRYAIESLLGSGSAGAVYKATHLGLRRPVAVKLLHDWNRASAQLVGRFKAEALAASKLDHPSLTRVLDCGEEGGTLYLVMEYVQGRTLEAVLAAQGRFASDRAVRVALQVLSALAVAHDAGIIHRDIKPENIMLLDGHDEEGRACDLVKVCDFGIAKLYDAGGAQELTRAGLILGSPVYMAPEQIRSERCDARTDIYGTGVTLFEMLTGAVPYDASDIRSLFNKKLSEPPLRPSSFLPEMDPLLEDIILHAIEPSAQARHASALQLRGELAEALKQLNPPASGKAFSIWPEA